MQLLKDAVLKRFQNLTKTHDTPKKEKKKKKKYDSDFSESPNEED